MLWLGTQFLDMEIRGVMWVGCPSQSPTQGLAGLGPLCLSFTTALGGQDVCVAAKNHMLRACGWWEGREEAGHPRGT